jgi:hypothetical protein
MCYILEVQFFHTDALEKHPEWNGKKEHIGYINKIFNSKEEASGYYHLYNQHMRKITSENNWCSDWDPSSKLLYVVRNYTGEFLKIPPFSTIF